MSPANLQWLVTLSWCVTVNPDKNTLKLTYMIFLLLSRLLPTKDKYQYSGSLQTTQICTDASWKLFQRAQMFSQQTLSLSTSVPSQRNFCRLRVVSPWVSTSAISPVSVAEMLGCQHVWWVRWHREICVVRHVFVSKTLKLKIRKDDEPGRFSSPTYEVNSFVIIVLCGCG